MKDKIAHLTKSDPVLARVIRVTTLAPRSPGTNHFRSLVEAIVNQQLSGKAADTILKRFVALFPGNRFPTPKKVLAMPVRKMRKAGLSTMKVSFIKDLARHVENRSINFRKIGTLEDEAVIERLTEVRGIGRWTAEMFLMFSLGRDDVFSYGDLGLRNAIQKLYKLKAHPTPAQAEKIVVAWKPYRTLASRYLWASLDNKKITKKK